MRGGRGGYVVPLVLIGLGVGALLGSLGVVPALSWGSLLRLWPLLLVLVGIDLLLGRRMPTAAIALEVLVIAGGLAYAASGLAPAGAAPGLGIGDCPPANAQRDVVVEREGASALELDLALGAGSFRVSGGASTLVEARSGTPAIALRHVSRDGGRAEVRLRACPAGTESGEVVVAVASDVPLTLDLDGGAGSFDIDLRDVRLAAAGIRTGASSVVLRPPAPQGNVRIEIDTGASSIEIELPAGAAARVESRGALSSFDAPGGSGGPFETAGFASAADRLTIVVSSGLSSVRVR